MVCCNQPDSAIDRPGRRLGCLARRGERKALWKRTWSRRAAAQDSVEGWGLRWQWNSPDGCRSVSGCSEGCRSGSFEGADVLGGRGGEEGDWARWFPAFPRCHGGVYRCDGRRQRRGWAPPTVAERASLSGLPKAEPTARCPQYPGDPQGRLELSCGLRRPHEAGVRRCGTTAGRAFDEVFNDLVEFAQPLFTFVRGVAPLGRPILVVTAWVE